MNRRSVNKAFVALLVATCVLVVDAKSQDSLGTRTRKMELGFWPGFGYGNNRKSLPEGNYSPYYLMAHLAVNPFGKGSSVLEKFRLYLEPQYNLVLIRPSGGEDNQEWELGLNLGVKYEYPLCKNLGVFVHIGTGPHTFSATTARQAPGYLFSDNMGIGLVGYMGDKWSVIALFRIRHLSNADTRQPNHGINTDNFHLGISRFLTLKGRK